MPATLAPTPPARSPVPAPAADDDAAAPDPLAGLRIAVAIRLAGAGVCLPPPALEALAEGVLAEALATALDWVEAG